MDGEASYIRNANDYVSDAVDAFYAGNTEQAKFCLKEAMETKLTNHFCDCLSDVYQSQEGTAAAQ